MIIDLPVNVSIQAVIVWYELILPLVVQLALQVHVLQVGQIRLVPRQGDGGHINHVFSCVVVKNLQGVMIDHKILMFCFTKFLWGKVSTLVMLG